VKYNKPGISGKNAEIGMRLECLFFGMASKEGDLLF
jgi:hypothetical protein